MTKPKVYYAQASPPARSTLLTIKALGLDVELIPVNLMAGEHMTPEYLKKNPLHTIPTLEDGDFAIFDSHAINAYLVGKYGKKDTLYPKDLQKKAIVDQRLHFDSGILFPRLIDAVRPLFNGKANSIEKDKADLIADAYQSLELLLKGHDYAAGNEITIADFNLVATVSSLDSCMVPVTADKYPILSAWFARLKALPYYDVNQAGVDQFKGFVQSKLA
nr:GSTe6 [Pagiophloeus tsushimanus]